mmetsp:Transcript_108987/g.213550  ORF Transcript_108987/g.213550 Transcript_108987/m.213550 type:complete len:394 (+) Transcript_108987:84-1265(+)|eukprot:CAMPEP_0170395360 /NCGR_PEP_ID=MMETSP0117_2-20130122/21737_1 /TAXON_ID=400756 /ORGANISM="Durinskia baltica, Strain CSIRO CS-38" /LENGTH=393 /DNA_ID=CAMNT_0010651665 /DNA_START=158 /DNA_END=1339 /DNA_ORIENTATION=+
MSDSNYYTEMDHIDLYGFEEVCDVAENLKYRSITVDSRPTTVFARASEVDVSSSKNYWEMKMATGSSYSTCPSAPFGMSKNSFPISRPSYSAVKESVELFLESQYRFDFFYVEGEFMWKGKYLCGSSCFELEVNLYYDTAANTYTVATRKISCDSSVNGCYNEFCSTMKNALSSDRNTTSAPARKKFCIPPSCGLIQVSDEDFLQGVQCIFSMSTCSLEARTQAAKMLCDVAQKAARYLELPAFHAKCVKQLELLVVDEVEDVRQYAVMAVAAFSELGSYQESFIHSSILPALFCLVENCQYETAQMRRTAASVLALLSRTHPFSVRAELDQQHQFDVVSWMHRAACLLDARTRESALIVKSSLEAASLPNTETLTDITVEGLVDGECIFASH